jgi:hypothetical protein
VLRRGIVHIIWEDELTIEELENVEQPVSKIALENGIN